MQKREMAKEAALWSPDDKNPVVGAWDWHESHADYDLLFAGLDTKAMVALEFGCGPGRMIARYADKFLRIDGADIDGTNLVNAKRHVVSSGREAYCTSGGSRFPSLFRTSGVDLAPIPDSLYDIVFSCITLQHIPVHSIRTNLFREFRRVLKPGGWFSAQMGFGDSGDYRGVGYYEDKWDAPLTNGACDVKVTNTFSLKVDLQHAGFQIEAFNDTFSYQIRPTGPNDWHPNWIFFRAQKPLERKEESA